MMGLLGWKNKISHIITQEEHSECSRNIDLGSQRLELKANSAVDYLGNVKQGPFLFWASLS